MNTAKEIARVLVVFCLLGLGGWALYAWREFRMLERPTWEHATEHLASALLLGLAWVFLVLLWIIIEVTRSLRSDIREMRRQLDAATLDNIARNSKG